MQRPQQDLVRGVGGQRRGAEGGGAARPAQRLGRGQEAGREQRFPVQVHRGRLAVARVVGDRLPARIAAERPVAQPRQHRFGDPEFRRPRQEAEVAQHAVAAPRVRVREGARALEQEGAQPGLGEGWQHFARLGFDPCVAGRVQRPEAADVLRDLGRDRRGDLRPGKRRPQLGREQFAAGGLHQRGPVRPAEAGDHRGGGGPVVPGQQRPEDARPRRRHHGSSASPTSRTPSASAS